MDLPKLVLNKTKNNIPLTQRNSNTRNKTMTTRIKNTIIAMAATLMVATSVNAAQTGNVDFTTRSLPSESIQLMAPAGSIELAIPSLFRGLVQIAAQTIETPVDARIVVRRAPGTATVLVGKRFTREERQKLPVEKRPGFWARARKQVSLSLAESAPAAGG